MAEPTREDLLRYGASILIGLIEVVKGMTETDFVDWQKANPGEDATDCRDYCAAVAVVRGTLLHNLNHYNEVRREGFLRALVDLLCVFGDGVTPTWETWDPIANTATGFSPQETVEVRHDQA
jgi:hypothetical protein